MSEVTRRGAAITARAVGNSVSPVVAVLCTLAGVSPTASVPIGALGGSVAEEIVNVISDFAHQRASRLGRFVDHAEQAALEDFARQLEVAAGDPRCLELLARAAEVAARSLDDIKIGLLAHVFVYGVQDQAKVDNAAIMIESLRDLEAPHIRLMALMAQPSPRSVPGRGHDADSIDVWGESEILSEGRGLAGALWALVGKLSSVGFIYDEGLGRLDYSPAWKLTDLGELCAAFLADAPRSSSEDAES